MTAKTTGKTHLSSRLDTETIDRIKSLSGRDNISIDDLLNNALDALEIQQRDPVLLSERLNEFQMDVDQRIGSLENNLIELIQTFGPHLQKIRALASITWHGIDYMNTNALDGETLKKWPTRRDGLLVSAGIVKPQTQTGGN